jgi:hypothetical protein
MAGPHDERQRRGRVIRNAVILALAALGVYAAFILSVAGHGS